MLKKIIEFMDGKKTNTAAGGGMLVVILGMAYKMLGAEESGLTVEQIVESVTALSVFAAFIFQRFATKKIDN